jgi:ABC-type transport system involved in multi-copper enzyme maturation permease subunit
MAENTVQPIYIHEDALTPREERLQRAAVILRWGAIANGIAAFVVILGGFLSGADIAGGLMQTVADVFFGRYDGAADTALITVMLLLLGNVSAVLVAMVGVLAQELWSILLIWTIVIVDAILLAWFGFVPALISIVACGYAGAIMMRDIRGFRINPVTLKELRERMRGARAFVVITVYLGLMSAFAVLLYLVQRGIVQDNGSAVTGELGRVVFAGVVGIEMLLIIFIAPAFTAGAVSNERERKTYDLLQITLLPKAAFIVGKLESALSYIVLLLLAAIPLQSIAFLFGGVSETELILAFVILAVTAISLGTVGLYFSTLVDRTLTASVRAYTVAFVVMVIVPLVFGYFVNIYNNALAGTGTGIVSSPVVESGFVYAGALLVSLNPVTAALATQTLLVDQREIGFWTATLSSDGSTIPMISPWISFTIIYLMASAVMVVLAVRRMRRVDE